MQLIDGIPVWGEADPGALEQIKRCALTAAKVALMADNHKGYAVPIGGVVAYSDAISPSGVGYDIGCGNKAVQTIIKASDVRPVIGQVMDEIWSVLSFGVGRKNNEPVDHDLFDDPAWTLEPAKSLKDKARAQLGTIGSGNHYVDLFEDESGYVWIGVHFGSRGFGHSIATHFLKAGGAKDGMDVDPLVIPVASNLGGDYLEMMRLAGEYAYAGRDWVINRVARILAGDSLVIRQAVHNHHNFAWKEKHDGEWLWVVRKGATPAFPGQRGFIGGSMGDAAYIVEGIENDLAHHSLYSTVHGAGRVMSRTAAAGKINRKTGQRITEGRISETMMADWLADKNVELRGAGLDEAPQAYKRIDEVIDAHLGTIKINHILQPMGVAMAGKHEHDPYKD